MSRLRPRSSRPHVVVVGGGYAGVMAAREAAASAVDVTLLDADGRHGFLPRLATVAAGVGPTDDADAPLQALLPRVKVRVGHASAVDHVGRVVKVEEGEALAYDALVLSAGAQASLPDIPGLADHAWPLRTPAQALELRTRLQAAESLVIVGGGPTGTQLAGEVSVQHRRMQVTVIEMADRILPNLPPALSRRATEILTRRGVSILTGRSLAEVGPHGAVLADGADVAGLVVWAGGVASNGAAVLPEAETAQGRIVVDDCGQVAGHGPVFVAGDLAAHRGADGEVLPQTAQVAVQAGKMAGANAVRATQDRRPRASTLRHLGWVLPLGGGQAVAQVGPLPLADSITGRLAPFLHDLIDLRHLLTVGGLPAATRFHQEF